MIRLGDSLGQTRLSSDAFARSSAIPLDLTMTSGTGKQELKKSTFEFLVWYNSRI